MASSTRYDASIRARTGRPGIGLMSDPCGMFMLMARLQPSLAGMVLSARTLRMAEIAEASEDEREELNMLETCGAVPSKSNVIAPCDTVTATRTVSGVEPRTSASTEASPVQLP